MGDEITGWYARQPERVRHHRLGAMRQCLEAAVRWGRMPSNPTRAVGRVRRPSPRAIRVYTRAELEATGAEMSVAYRTMPMFGAAVGLRLEELFALERRDIDRRPRLLTVRQTISGGELVELGKTTRSRRQVPLSQRALEALDAITPRLDTPLVFPAPMGGLVNIDNWRRREWAPAIEAAGIRRPARPYDLRATFIIDALHAGVPVFTVAKVAGTSVAMIERSYGTLVDGAELEIAGRLDALDAERDRAAEGGP